MGTVLTRRTLRRGSDPETDPRAIDCTPQRSDHRQFTHSLFLHTDPAVALESESDPTTVGNGPRPKPLYQARTAPE